MMAAVLILIIVTIVFTMALCKAAAEEDKLFQGYLYCDDDCYMCDYQKKCIRSAMKYN